MRNFIQPGKVLTAVAGAGGVRSGELQVVGSIFGIAATSAAQGEEYELAVGEVYEQPKAAGAAAMGAPAFWDATNRVVTATAGSNLRIGVFAQAAAAAAGIAVVRLNDQV